MSRWMAASLAAMTGVAIAAFNLRAAITDNRDSGEMIFFALVGLGIALTAAGPTMWFLGQRPRIAAERMGPMLWAILGAPWWIATLDLSLELPGHLSLYQLIVGPMIWVINVLALVALILGWSATVVRNTGRPVSWSQGIGMALAVAWPVQIGLGLVVAVVNE
jgi:hypothetical protein